MINIMVHRFLTERIALTSLLLMLLLPLVLHAQCEIQIKIDTNSYNVVEICTGDSLVLHAEGECILFKDDFNNMGWSSDWFYHPAQAMFSNPCSNGGNNTPHVWFGDLTPTQRELVTKDFDLTSGGYISFELRYGLQGHLTPCDGPDEMREGVSLQYSTDGGDYWEDIAYFAPNGTILPSNPMTLLPTTYGQTAFTSWATYTFPIPPGAQTTETRFRWVQYFANYFNGHYDDSWGLDNVVVSRSIVMDTRWDHGPSITNPPTIKPLADSLYVVYLLDYEFPYDTVATDSLLVIVHPIPAFEFISDTTTICQGDTLGIQLSGNFDYLWSDGTVGSNHVVMPYENVTYSVTSTDNIGCIHIDSLTIIVQPLPLIQVFGDTICYGEMANLNATGGVAYLWSNGDTTAAIQGSPPVSSYYIVTVTGQNNCIKSGSAYLMVRPLPTAQANGDTTICSGGFAVLTAKGGIQYNWSTGSPMARVEVDPLVNSWYTVTVTDMHGCSQDDSVLVRVNPFVSFGLSKDPDTMCRGTAAILEVEGGHHFLWNTGENTPSIEVYPGKSMVYTVTVSEDYYDSRCYLSKSILVNVRECNTFHIANAFNPQGYTTVFKPVGEYFSIRDYYFAVYDRWGRMVFETTDPDAGWNGRIKGEYAPNAVYVYQVRFTKVYLEETFERIGTITVIR